MSSNHAWLPNSESIGWLLKIKWKGICLKFLIVATERSGFKYCD